MLGFKAEWTCCGARMSDMKDMRPNSRSMSECKQNQENHNAAHVLHMSPIIFCVS
jgi:hypothetical protein